MNCTNPYEFETITEKILRIVLENIKGTPQNRNKEIWKHVNFLIIKNKNSQRMKRWTMKY